MVIAFFRLRVQVPPHGLCLLQLRQFVR
jgi:hypothetical protein